MNREQMKEQFELAKINDCGICIEISMPNQIQNELIINDNGSLDVKLEYYLSAYDEYLVHKNNSEIIIYDIYPVIVNNSHTSVAERIEFSG